MNSRDLNREFLAALFAMERDDAVELVDCGVPFEAIANLLVGIARVSRVVDAELLYEPDPTGVLEFITPVRVDEPMNPESHWPWHTVRRGEIVDLLAWDPRQPDQWALRVGIADWLGAVEPQLCDPEPVWIWRTPLDWLRADCAGIVPVSNDPARIYSLIMRFTQGGSTSRTSSTRLRCGACSSDPGQYPKFLLPLGGAGDAAASRQCSRHRACQNGHIAPPYDAAPQTATGVALADFYAYMPEHRYLFVPTGDLWPAASVNGRIRSIPLDVR
jgi:hypothetical protein